MSRERDVLQASRATIEALMRGLVHEVRNPLNCAGLQLEVLERRLRVWPRPELAAPLNEARKEIRRLADFLDEFLVLVQPTDLTFAEHDLVAMGREVIAKEQGFASQRRASLTLEPSAGSVLAHVDAPKLQQIVHRLVRNGIEAVAHGGEVAVAIATSGDQLRISVRDNGAGIPAELRSRIYEPFFTTKPGNAGLGMSVVQSIVALHAGGIELSTSPRGTHVEITLPRRT